MDQEGLHGIAHTWPLHLGIIRYLFGHTNACGLIHVNVADPLVMFQHWNPGVFGNKTDQGLTPPWYDEVHTVVLSQEGIHSQPIPYRDHLGRRFWYTRFPECLLDDTGKHRIGIECL